MQVIEVRLVDPKDNGVIADEFTQVDTHEQGIRATLRVWSGGRITLRASNRVGDGVFGRNGGTTYWMYTYDCTLNNNQHLNAILFATYKEKESNA